MAANGRSIPDITLEAVSRTFFKEAERYGFSHLDYVKFVNHILDMAMKDRNGTTKGSEPRTDPDLRSDLHATEVRELPVQGDRVTIRPFVEKQDRDLVEAWLTDPRGRYFMLSRTTSRRESFDDVVRNQGNVIGIITLRDSNPIGCVAFLNLDEIQRKAELRKLIGDPKQRGKGLAREASALWIRYGLDGLGLNKIYLNTLDTDIRNVSLNEELGFKVEGILRNEVLIDNVYHDVLRMGLLRPARLSTPTQVLQPGHGPAPRGGMVGVGP